jgi:hypothetical protein
VIAILRRTGIVAVAAAALALTVAAPASPAQAASKGVRIITVQYDSPGSDRGSNESLNAEWVRIKNTGKKPRKIGGFTLSDETGYTYTFAKRTLKPGQSIRVRTGKGEDKKANKYWGRGWYVWNNDGDTATLRTGKGKTVDTCEWDGGEQKQAC